MSAFAKIIAKVIGAYLFPINFKSADKAVSIEPVVRLARLNTRTYGLLIHPFLWHWVPLIK